MTARRLNPTLLLMKAFRSAIAAIAVLALSAGFAAAADTVNDKCPVSGKAEVPKSVDFKVSFCCGKCVTKFEADPVSFASKVGSAKEGKCPVSGRDIDDSKTSTVKIGVCCGKCSKKVKADPAKYFAKLK